jgi:hypothetical protein
LQRAGGMRPVYQSKSWLALSAAAALAAATTATGCGCTAAGCFDVVSITLHDAELSDGQWEVEVSSPSFGTRVCELPIPLVTQADLVCSDGLYLGLPFQERAPRRLQTVEVLFEGEPPAALTLTFRRDGNEVASAALEPTYDTVRPNGRGCDPTCQVATETFTLSLD